MVVTTQEIEEGKAVEDAGMGTTNQSVKSALVTVLLLLKVTTIILLVQLIMVLCKFRLNRARSREISLVISLAVVTTICRMVKVLLLSLLNTILFVIRLVSFLQITVNLLPIILVMLINHVEHMMFYLVIPLM
ncbi:hypothetical protein ACOSQ3_021541 [Xanthoceras sorbifolium]